MKVLILGAKGSLGQTFLDIYKDQEVTGWDRAELDITDGPAVSQKISELKPDLVINCAAYNAVDKAEEERQIAEQVNGSAVGNIAKAVVSIGAVVVHYSTGQVFDGSKSEGYNEDGQANPINAYGKSKLAGEMELRGNMENFYLIRTCWLYGKTAAGKKSFPDMILELAGKSETIKAVNAEFGNPTYVVDLAQATKALVEQKKPYGIYHLVNSGMASRYDWAKEVFMIKRIEARLKPVDSNFFARRAERPKYEVLNNTKFIQLRPWTEALREYLIPND